MRPGWGRGPAGRRRTGAAPRGCLVAGSTSVACCRAGDVVQHDLGQAGQEAQPQVAVAGLRHDEQLRRRAAGPGHGGDRGGGSPARVSGMMTSGVAGQAAVPDPAERLGPAGAGRLQAGEGGEQGHAAPPARSLARGLLAWRSARAMSAWSADGSRVPLARASAVPIVSRPPRSSRDGRSEHVQGAGGAGLVAAEARQLAGLAGSAAGTGRGPSPGRRRARRAAGLGCRRGRACRSKVSAGRQLVEQRADPGHPGQLAAQDADLLADVEEGGGGLGGEVLRGDQDGVGGHRGRRAATRR